MDQIAFSTASSLPGQPRESSCPSLFLRSPLTLLLPLNQPLSPPTMPWCHASPDVAGHFASKAAAVNLSPPRWEGRREWPGGRPPVPSSHLLAQFLHCGLVPQCCDKNTRFWSACRHSTQSQSSVPCLLINVPGIRCDKMKLVIACCQVSAGKSECRFYHQMFQKDCPILSAWFAFVRTYTTMSIMSTHNFSVCLSLVVAFQLYV